MSPLDLIPVQYRVAAELAVLGVALAAAGTCGALVMHWRDNSQLQTERATFANAQSAALDAAVRARDAAIAQRDALAGKLASIDAQGVEQLRRSEHETQNLAARVDTGAVRLRVRADCGPAAHDVPEAPARGGVDSGSGAELAAAARQDYYALRRAIGAVQTQLTACQHDLGTLTGQRAPSPAVAPGAASNAP